MSFQAVAQRPKTYPREVSSPFCDSLTLMKNKYSFPPERSFRREDMCGRAKADGDRVSLPYLLGEVAR